MSQNTEQAGLVDKINKYNPTIRETLFTGCDIICLSPKQYYAFNKQLSKFWKDYNEASLNLIDSHLSFAENFQIPPVMFHFNFCIEGIVRRNPILSSTLIEELVRLAQELVNDKIMLDNNEQAICYVLISNVKQIDRITNINLQLRFPYIHMNNHEQKTLVMAFKQSLIGSQILYHTDLQFIKPYDSLILEYSANNPPLYGSGDDLRPRLFFDQAYGYNTNTSEKLNIFQAFDIRKHYYISKGYFKDPYFKCSTHEDYEKLIPFFMSMYYGYDGTDKAIVNDVMAESIISETSSMYSPDEPNYFRAIFKSQARIEFPNRSHTDWLLNNINEERFLDDDRINERIVIGKALYNLYSGSNEGLQKWLEHLNSDIDPHEYRELYHSFNSAHRYTAKTLLYLAKLDNPEDYQSWHFNQCVEIYEDCLYNLTDANVAMALYRTFADSIFYLSDLKRWYEFDSKRHRLIQCDNEMLYQTINYKFCQVFEELSRVYEHKLKTTPNMITDERDVLTDKRKKCTSLITKLRGVRFKNCILTEAKSLFAIHEGLKYLDTDPNLLCVQTGVFEFYQNRIRYRDGVPEDFINKSTGVSYDPDSITSEMRLSLMDVLKKIYPDPEILDFIINFDAICLRGGNTEKLIMFLISPGNTGKSTMVMIKEAMFGDYSGRFEFSEFTASKRSQGGPNPARAEAANCRQVYFQEFGKDIVSSNFIKTESGNEPYRARRLNENGGVLKPLYRLVGSSNFPPVFDTIDDAIINRCIYIPHWSTFKTDAPKDQALQWKKRIFPPDLSLQNKYGVLAKTYLCILYERYDEVAQKGLLNLIPLSIKKFTRQFFSGEDKMLSFLDECLIHCDENSGCSLKTSQLFDRYKTWMRSKRDEPENLTTFTLNIKNYLAYVPRGHIHYDIENDTWINVCLKENEIGFRFQSQI